ncbi:hypothetical protein Tco_1217834 [Tanacetum coccineum]
MSSITSQQTKLDLELVHKENRIDIDKCNGRIPCWLTPREPTFQVTLDAIALTSCYPAFLITADVLEVYMHQFWNSICLRVPDREFDPLPSKVDTVSFLRELGHTRVINSLNDVVVDQMHQPWRTFAALINRSLSGKTSGDSIRTLIEVERDRKGEQGNFGGKGCSVLICYRIYGAVLPECLTSPEMKESKAYKTYLGHAIGVVPPKIARKFKKASPTKKDNDLVPVDEEPVTKGKRVKRSVKKSSTKPATCIVIREPPVEAKCKGKEKERKSGSRTDAEKSLSVEKITPTVISEGIDEDDNNNKQEESNEGSGQENESEQQESDSEQDEESDDDNQEEEEVDQENKSKDDEIESDEDKGMDDTTDQFDNDVDAKLEEPTQTGKEIVQGKGADVEMDEAQQGNENLETTQEQVVDAHVTITTFTKKTEVPVTSSSHSSNLASKFLNFSDIPQTNAEIVSSLDVHVHHEVPRTQAPTLLTIPVSVITESSGSLPVRRACLKAQVAHLEEVQFTVKDARYFFGNGYSRFPSILSSLPRHFVTNVHCYRFYFQSQNSVADEILRVYDVWFILEHVASALLLTLSRLRFRSMNAITNLIQITACSTRFISSTIIAWAFCQPKWLDWELKELPISGFCNAVFCISSFLGSQLMISGDEDLSWRTTATCLWVNKIKFWGEGAWGAPMGPGMIICPDSFWSLVLLLVMIVVSIAVIVVVMVIVVVIVVCCYCWVVVVSPTLNLLARPDTTNVSFQSSFFLWTTNSGTSRNSCGQYSRGHHSFHVALGDLVLALEVQSLNSSVPQSLIYLRISSDHIPPLPGYLTFLSSDDDTSGCDTPDCTIITTHGSLSLRFPLLPSVNHLSYIVSGYDSVTWTTIPHDSSSEASSDFHSDASSDPSSRHSLSDHSSPDLPSTSAGPSRKRRRSPMTSVPALSPRGLVCGRDDAIVRVSDEPHLEQDIDPEIQAEIDECIAYADALRDRGIDARVVVEAVDRDETKTGVRGPVEVRVERVTHPAMPEDIPEPAQEGAVEATYETLGDLREQGHRIVGVESAVIALTERIAELERDNRRLRGTASVESQRVDRLQRGMSRYCEELRQMLRRRKMDNGGNGNGRNEEKRKLETEMGIMDSAFDMWNSHKRTIGVEAAYAMNWVELMKLMTKGVDFVVSEWSLMKKTSGLRFIGGLTATTLKGNVIVRTPGQTPRCYTPLLTNDGQEGPRATSSFKRQNTSGKNMARAYTTGKMKERGRFGKDCPKLRKSYRGNQTRKRMETRLETILEVNELRLRPLRHWIIRSFPVRIDLLPAELGGSYSFMEIEALIIEVIIRTTEIPGAATVARAPYRLAPAEMQELSTQIVIDIGKPEQALVKNRYPLLRIDDLFDQLTRVKSYTLDRTAIMVIINSEEFVFFVIIVFQLCEEDISKTALGPLWANMSSKAFRRWFGFDAVREVIAYASANSSSLEKNYTTHGPESFGAKELNMRQDVFKEDFLDMMEKKKKDSTSGSSKGTKSQPKSSGKSVQSEEPVFEVADSDMPHDQEGNMGDNKVEPRKEIASKHDWFKKPTPPQEPTDPD